MSVLLAAGLVVVNAVPEVIGLLLRKIKEP